MLTRHGRAFALLAALAVGCGATHEGVADACRGTGRQVAAALDDAPGSVRLRDGTRLSDCVAGAVDAAELQNVGASFTAAAARLARAAPRDRDAALRLGYLIGAVERGAGRTAGFQAELENRMRAFLEDPELRGARRASARRGRSAGQSHG
jgi:hypothetical protein